MKYFNKFVHGGRNQNISQLECLKIWHTFLKMGRLELLKKLKIKILSSSPISFLDTHNLGLKYESHQNQLKLTSEFSNVTMSIHAKFQVNRSTQLTAIVK